MKTLKERVAIIFEETKQYDEKGAAILNIFEEVCLIPVSQLSAQSMKNILLAAEAFTRNVVLEDEDILQRAKKTLYDAVFDTVVSIINPVEDALSLLECEPEDLARMLCVDVADIERWRTGGLPFPVVFDLAAHKLHDDWEASVEYRKHFSDLVELGKSAGKGVEIFVGPAYLVCADLSIKIRPLEAMHNPKESNAARIEEIKRAQKAIRAVGPKYAVVIYQEGKSAEQCTCTVGFCELFSSLEGVVTNFLKENTTPKKKRRRRSKKES
jgi:hypothetical protein